MTSADFNRMPKRERIDWVLNFGHYAAKRFTIGYMVLLYSLDRQFFEVFLNKKTQKAEWIERMVNDKKLDLYLNDIKLEDLF